MKYCPKCDKNKPVTEFYRNKGHGLNNLRSWCITCVRLCNKSPARRAYQKRWREANKEKCREASERWRRDNTEHVNQKSKNRMAMRRGARIVGTFSADDWHIKLGRSEGYCTYCKNPASVLHQDHVYPVSRGGDHSIENITPACCICNRSKGSKTLLEWTTWMLDLNLQFPWTHANES